MKSEINLRFISDRHVTKIFYFVKNRQNSMHQFEKNSSIRHQQVMNDLHKTSA